MIFLGDDETKLLCFWLFWKIFPVTFKQGQKKAETDFSFLSCVFQIAYKADYKHDIVDYNYPATLTPSYQTTMKLVPLKDVSSLPALSRLFPGLPSERVILRLQDRGHRM